MIFISSRVSHFTKSLSISPRALCTWWTKFRQDSHQRGPDLRYTIDAAWYYVLSIQNLCTGRFPRPDELLDINFEIETNRSYNLIDDYNKELIKDPNFGIKKCVRKNCFMHLDFQYNSEEAIWESKMVRIKKDSNNSQPW